METYEVVKPLTHLFKSYAAGEPIELHAGEAAQLKVKDYVKDKSASLPPAAASRRFVNES